MIKTGFIYALEELYLYENFECFVSVLACQVEIENVQIVRKYAYLALTVNIVVWGAIFIFVSRVNQSEYAYQRQMARLAIHLSIQLLVEMFFERIR